MGCGASGPMVPFTDVVRGELENSNGEKRDSDSLIQGKVKLVLFSANVSPANEFPLQVLRPLYTNLKQRNLQFEIVFVSQDMTEESYKAYLQMMPWWSVPYADAARRSNLPQTFGCQGPRLIILSEKDEVISMDGIQVISKDPNGAEFPWKPKSDWAGVAEDLAGM